MLNNDGSIRSLVDRARQCQAWAAEADSPEARAAFLRIAEHYGSQIAQASANRIVLLAMGKLFQRRQISANR